MRKSSFILLHNLHFIIFMAGKTCCVIVVGIGERVKTSHNNLLIEEYKINFSISINFLYNSSIVDTF